MFAVGSFFATSGGYGGKTRQCVHHDSGLDFCSRFVGCILTFKWLMAGLLSVFFFFNFNSNFRPLLFSFEFCCGMSSRVDLAWH